MTTNLIGESGCHYPSHPDLQRLLGNAYADSVRIRLTCPRRTCGDVVHWAQTTASTVGGQTVYGAGVRLGGHWEKDDDWSRPHQRVALRPRHHDHDEPEKVAFTCHCGASSQVRPDTLVKLFVSAYVEGATKVPLP